MSVITNPRLARLWQDAQTHPEWATTRLWEYLFNHIVFTDDNFIVSSQQPPTHQPGELRRVDLVIEKMDSTATTIGTLLFLEAKRASASRTDIEEVEYQAFTAACAYYIETGLEPIWTMTCVGSAARLWIFSGSSDFLIPFVPSDGGLGLPEQSEYLDISTHGREILDGLEYIKKHTTPPAELLRNSPSPRPANATLPVNWHDNEVAQLDARRQQGDIVPMAAAPLPMDLNQDEHGISYGSGNERFA
ncbi:hypothetical protein MYCTH_2063233 [Thermothelomyces thermophilus ATCC 42464]|uniref:Type I restriction enzyme R protein N-terminal domain-containing protein n=1 Tax=Thermothelomyces thermophilus (strain ATCC 42464 / BCRC 31852 / DSM 1799) TaxID=573729 RepID=G2QGX4_THET4|nr:uncharacterized protein MYCTH_2063233 [Thermothelomyces thermophilus ATCC 42464]AEO59481.1 hypothetical protein MYCTH_2063233 [Thermothelomyces thermophilus ATCC 42464]